eukprot:jgi/Hompol1/6247/HPOL_002241-RA
MIVPRSWHGSPFVDHKYIKVCAGNGGDGAISFFKGTSGPMGPPSGGNGGRGGDVWITASKNVTSLNGVLNRYFAKNGKVGGGKQMHGQDGDDVEILVPVGTLVKQIQFPHLKRIAAAAAAAEAATASDPKLASATTQAVMEAAASVRELEENEAQIEAAEAAAKNAAPAPAQTQTSEAASTRSSSVNKLDQEGQDADDFEDEDDDTNAIDEERKRRTTGVSTAAPVTPSDERMELLSKYFKFRNQYLPQEDRIRMLMERLPRHQQTPAPVHFELLEDGERRLVMRGGRGGLGNPHFVTPVIQGPGIAGRGIKVSPILLELELKTMADAGLVGLPNAGKSTLLAATSNAHPKIAPYPFTTLNPYVGTIDFDDFWTMTIADIPGIISGANQNLGLGHRFLRHIERTKLLVYVIDLAGEAPWSDLETLQFELEAFKTGMTDRPSLIAANKADVADVARDNFEILKTKTSIPIVPISAKHQKNIIQFTGVMRKMVEEINAREAEQKRLEAKRNAEASTNPVVILTKPE